LYVKTNWVDDVTPLSAENMNKIENELSLVASETVVGKVELATAAETTTGTNSTRAVHPAGLKVELDKKIPLTQKGIANGIAPLGSDSKLPLANTITPYVSGSYTGGASTVNVGFTPSAVLVFNKDQPADTVSTGKLTSFLALTGKPAQAIDNSLITDAVTIVTNGLRPTVYANMPGETYYYMAFR